MTRDEFYIRVWREYYDNAVAMHDLAPTAYADRMADWRMRTEALKNLVTWDEPAPEGA
jgi:hypothetical protein